MHMCTYTYIHTAGTYPLHMYIYIYTYTAELKNTVNQFQHLVCYQTKLDKFTIHTFPINKPIIPNNDIPTYI